MSHSDDELDDLIDASDKSQEGLTHHEAWLTPSAGGYKIQLQEDVHGRTLVAGFVDDRVREQSGLQVDDVILSIGGERVEGLAFARTTEMIRHHAREFETLVLKVSRTGAPEPAPAGPPLATGDDLEGLTVAQLKDRLRALHLPLSGLKSALKERLRKHYASHPFATAVPAQGVAMATDVQGATGRGLSARVPVHALLRRPPPALRETRARTRAARPVLLGPA